MVFGDGDAWSPDTKVQFHQGSRSRTFDLPGGARVVRSVEFWYRSERARGRAGALEGPLGRVPRREDLIWNGLDYSEDKYREVMTVTKAGVAAETEELKGYFQKFGTRLPAEIERQRLALADRGSKMPEVWKP